MILREPIMSRAFAYCRVSTLEQNNINQISEIEGAGFRVEPHRVIQETVSGSMSAMERPGFQKLFEKLEAGDILIVTKLDRLGRNAIDVRKTIEKLSSIGVKVHCLALGGVDLTSAPGKMTMQVINAVSEFERDLLIERTHAGLVRAKKEGRRLGRPPAHGTRSKVQELKNQMLSQSQVAKKLNIGIATVKRHWNIAS